MCDVLIDVIRLGGEALEAEDSLLRGISQKRDKHGGLLCLELERYYQFIVWKSLLGTYHAEIERSREGGYLVDLVVESAGTEHIFEMKYWREETSSRVNSDIRRLRLFGNGGNLLVFSANPCEPKGQTDAAIDYLIGESPTPQIGPPVSCYRFLTKNPRGMPFEFWFAGWHIPSRQD